MAAGASDGCGRVVMELFFMAFWLPQTLEHFL